MSIASSAVAWLAPSAAPTGGSRLPVTIVVIVLVLAIIGGLAIFGWRSPDRSPGADTKAQRDRIED